MLVELEKVSFGNIVPELKEHFKQMKELHIKYIKVKCFEENKVLVIRKPTISTYYKDRQEYGVFTVAYLADKNFKKYLPKIRKAFKNGKKFEGTKSVLYVEFL